MKENIIKNVIIYIAAERVPGGPSFRLDETNLSHGIPYNSSRMI